MSLSIGEDVLLWHLRLTHLRNIKDGVGERLISLDVSLQKDPILRAAGYDFETVPRTYSPPISTDGGLSSDYFVKPLIKTKSNPELQEPHFLNKEGLLVDQASREAAQPVTAVRRRRNREQQEDDSSDLSDDSDYDAEESRRAAQQVKFSIADRQRSTSSSSQKVGESRRASQSIRIRRFDSSPSFANNGSSESAGTIGSHSSDQDISSPRHNRFRKRSHSDISSSSAYKPVVIPQTRHPDGGDPSNLDVLKSRASSISSGFGDLADSASLLDGPEVMLLGADSLADGLAPLPTHSRPSSSPKKPDQIETLQSLPPARPISRVLPSSVLGKALTALRAKPKNPLQQFAKISGQGSQHPLEIKILAPFSSDQSVFEADMQTVVADETAGATQPVTVADAIGYCLYRYCELEMEPVIEYPKLDVNRWVLRIVDDGEVEYDFPPLTRTASITDFTSNNNRPLRGRRVKAYDVFALVEATEQEYEENKKLTPKYTRLLENFVKPPPEPLAQERPPTTSQLHTSEDISSAEHDQSSSTQANASLHVTHRQGMSTKLIIRFANMDGIPSVMQIEVSADTYIAEVLEIACRQLSIDRTQHYLRIAGTSTLAPLDRFVEVLGPNRDLELVRRRFASEAPLGYPGSFTSSSPTEPLLINANEPAAGSSLRRPRRPGILNGDQILPSNARTTMQDLWGNPRDFKKWNVMRKQPMSFAATHARTIMVDSDYLHILPGESGRTMFDTSGKTSTVPYSMIVGCKVSRRHPRSFRVVVFREKETKRYDFEAADDNEAQEIVTEIRKGMEPFAALTGRDQAR